MASIAPPLPPPSTARSGSSRRGGGGPRFARGTATSECRSHGLDAHESTASAFRPNSYTGLRQGPQTTGARVVDNGPFRLRTTSRDASVRGGGARHELEPFGTLAYIPSPYNAVQVERLRAMEANRDAIEKVHGKKSTFTVRSPTRGGGRTAGGGGSPTRSLSPPDASAVVLSAAPPATESVTDQYGTLELVRRQEELDSLQKRVAGPFRPTAATDKALRQPTRLRLREIMLALCQAVISDLRATAATATAGGGRGAKDDGVDGGGATTSAIAALRPSVLATQEGLLAIRFQCGASPELHKAMNRMLVHNQVIRDEHLTKLQGSWGIPADASGGAATMYLLRPPWVRPPSRLPLLLGSTGGASPRSPRS